MRKVLAVLPALCLMLCGCGAAPAEGQTELIVFAAASMTETLTELGELYTGTRPDVELVFNFDSSGTLKTQIEEGAACDIFLSAGQKQMDELDAVQADTRFDMLENKIVLAVPEGNPGGIDSFAAMADGLRAGELLLAMGNSDVPAGQYAQKLLAHFALDEGNLAAAGCITYASNVKEVVTHVEEAAADCGIIYQTDAYAAGLTVTDTASAEMCGQVIYPAAVLRQSAAPDTAQDFLAFLTTETADAVFERAGFTPIA